MRAAAQLAVKKALATALGTRTRTVPVLDVLAVQLRQRDLISGLEQVVFDSPEVAPPGSQEVLEEARAIRDALDPSGGLADTDDMPSAEDDFRGYAVDVVFLRRHLEERLAEVEERAKREGMVLAVERLSQVVSHMARIGLSAKQISDRLADTSQDVAAYAEAPLRKDWRPTPEQIEMAKQAVEEGLKVDPRWWPFLDK